MIYTYIFLFKEKSSYRVRKWPKSVPGECSGDGHMNSVIFLYLIIIIIYLFRSSMRRAQDKTDIFAFGDESHKKRSASSEQH